MAKREKRDFGVKQVESHLECLERLLAEQEPTRNNTIQTGIELTELELEFAIRITSWARDTIVQQQLTSKKLRLKQQAFIKAAKEHLTPAQQEELDRRVELKLLEEE